MQSGAEARLAVGTAQFGLHYGIANSSGQVSKSAANAMLNLAASHGIEMLDTAAGYGDSESCLGEIGTTAFRVVTKLPAVPEQCGDVARWVADQVSQSLQRLRVRHVYGLLLHRPQQLLGPDGRAIYRALRAAKDAGYVEHIGISIYAPAELSELTPVFDFDLIQAPFNVVDRRLLSSGWLARLSDAGIEVHTRSAFLQGLLLMGRGEIPHRFAQWADLWDRWHEWLAAHRVSAVQAAVAYPLSFSEIGRVVIGADRLEQLAETIAAAAAPLGEEPPDIQCDAEDLVNPSRWS